MDELVTFLEEVNHIGLIFPNYQKLHSETKRFLSELADAVAKLKRDPDVPIEGLADRTNAYKKITQNVSTKIHAIDIGETKQALKQIQGVQKELDDIVKTYAKLRNDISFGGNYMRAVIQRPKVYSKKVDPEVYGTINENIREVDRGMDWLEKGLLDLYLAASHDEDMLRFVHRVYAKQSIYESTEGRYELTQEEQAETGNSPSEVVSWMRSHIAYLEFSPDWRLQSPAETFQNRAGNCHDQSLLLSYLFNDNGIPSGQLFFIEFRHGSNEGGMTHTLTWVRIPQEEDHLYWIETAWADCAGIHGPYDTFNDLRQDVFQHYAKTKGKDEHHFDGIMFGKPLYYADQKMRSLVGLSLGAYLSQHRIVANHPYYLFNTKEEDITEAFDWMEQYLYDDTFRDQIYMESETPYLEAAPTSTTEDSNDEQNPSPDLTKEEPNQQEEAKPEETPKEEPAEEEGPPPLEDLPVEGPVENNTEPKEETPAEEKPKEPIQKPMSMPKQADAEESDKNGVRRKKLYIAFIEWCKDYNSRNTFGSIFDKDAFHVTYPFVPHEMRYFYRLANPLLCVLPGSLTFFQVAELKNLNRDNKHMDQYLIFAATEKDYRVFSTKDKKVYQAVDENGVVVPKLMLGETFDLYIQDMIKKGDILHEPLPEKEKEPRKEEDNT